VVKGSKRALDASWTLVAAGKAALFTCATRELTQGEVYGAELLLFGVSVAGSGAESRFAAASLEGLQIYPAQRSVGGGLGEVALARDTIANVFRARVVVFADDGVVLTDSVPRAAVLGAWVVVFTFDPLTQTGVSAESVATREPLRAARTSRVSCLVHTGGTAHSGTEEVEEVHARVCGARVPVIAVDIRAWSIEIEIKIPPAARGQEQ